MYSMYENNAKTNNSSFFKTVTHLHFKDIKYTFVGFYKDISQMLKKYDVL